MACILINFFTSRHELTFFIKSKSTFIFPVDFEGELFFLGFCALKKSSPDSSTLHFRCNEEGANSFPNKGDESCNLSVFLKNKVFGKWQIPLLHCVFLRSPVWCRDKRVSNDGGFVPDSYHLFKIGFPVPSYQYIGFPLFRNNLSVFTFKLFYLYKVKKVFS